MQSFYLTKFFYAQVVTQNNFRENDLKWKKMTMKKQVVQQTIGEPILKSYNGPLDGRKK